MTQDNSDKSTDGLLRRLVVASRRGDQVAYRKLLTELAPLVRRMVAARVGKWGQQHAVDDVTQETLLAVHLKLHTYDMELSFLAWVNAVARHKLIDYLRRAKMTTISIDDDNLPELIDSANPENPVIALDLHKLLQQLKPPAGEIIYALKVEGASVRDLAATHKLSEANIKVIVHRGLQKLAQLAGVG